MKNCGINYTSTLSTLKHMLPLSKIFVVQGGGLSNTVCIAIDDNTVIRKVNQR
jgi:hypothetical protein